MRGGGGPYHRPRPCAPQQEATAPQQEATGHLEVSAVHCGVSGHSVSAMEAGLFLTTRGGVM